MAVALFWSIGEYRHFPTKLDFLPSSSNPDLDHYSGNRAVNLHYSYTSQRIDNDSQHSSAMGKSRSAAIVCAYLMRRNGITAEQALAQLREGRPLCEPNEGFMKQLELFHTMATPENVEETPAYQRWVYQREVEMSRACGQAPEADKIRFEDEHDQPSESNYELRCRKCRCVLESVQVSM